MRTHLASNHSLARSALRMLATFSAASLATTAVCVAQPIPGAPQESQLPAETGAAVSIAETPSIPGQYPLSYPTSAQVLSSPLDPTRRDLLHQLLYLSQRADFKAREDTREKLCGSVIHRPESSQSSVKAALTVTEADMSVEILFKKGTGPGVETPGEKFSFEIKMDDTHVLVRSSLPRFSTEAAGLSIPFPSDHTRPLWLEGKGGTNMLVLVPTVKECAVRAVVLCPRTYDGHGALLQSKYTPVGARYSIKTKSDGLFSAPKGAGGKIVASTRGSQGVPVPEPWFKESLSASTASVTFKHISPEQSEQPFTAITLPSDATLESRLDFGTEGAVLREVWSRSSIEVSEIKLEDWPSVHVRTADLRVESGACYLVTQFSEMQL